MFGNWERMRNFDMGYGQCKCKWEDFERKNFFFLRILSNLLCAYFL